MTQNTKSKKELFLTRLHSAEKAVTCFLQVMFSQREGRIDRLQFLFAFGILFYVFSLSLDVGTALVDMFFADTRRAHFILFIVLAALFQRPWQALYTKRLHDFNQTGWLFFVGMLMIYCSMPILQHAIVLIDTVKSDGLFDAATFKQVLDKEKAFLIITLLYNFFLLLVVLLKPGTEGENKYGADPLRNVDDSVRFSHIIQFCKIR